MNTTLEDFRQEILKELGITTSGSIPHGVSQEVMELAAERYANKRVEDALAVIINAIAATQYQSTNEVGDKTDDWVTDIETINKVDFKSLLGLQP